MDKRRPIAADLSGTWDTHPEIHGEVDFIVTASDWRQAENKEEEFNIDIPVYWNPGKEELMDIVNHKANVINKQNVEKFYEDQKIQVQLLKALCPNTRIILVNNGVTAI